MIEPVVDVSDLPQLVPGWPMLEGSPFGLDHLTVVLGSTLMPGRSDAINGDVSRLIDKT